MDTAKKAEQTLRFESGQPKQSFINTTGYWDDGRHGINAGEQLSLALRRMDLFYNENRFHDFEISKDISLRQLSAKALLELRQKGVATFDLPEALFDFDFPGHYCRRIKSISVSVHCLAGPYTGLNATLTLTSHVQRINEAVENDKYMNQGDGDSRFGPRNFYIPISEVAISSGQYDTGVFELDFKTSTYQPFEGAGAISSWKLEMPADFRQFDYDTISDVVLQLRYTSKKGDDNLRKAAVKSLTTYMKQAKDWSSKYGLHMLINIRSDYPDGWVPFAIPTTIDTDADTEVSTRQVVLTRLREHLPFFGRSADFIVTGITVYVAFSKGSARTLYLTAPQTPTANTTESPSKGFNPVEVTAASASYQDLVTFECQLESLGSRNNKDAFMGTAAALQKLLSKDSDNASSALKLVVEFDRADPGRAQQALVLLEYKQN